MLYCINALPVCLLRSFSAHGSKQAANQQLPGLQYFEQHLYALDLEQADTPLATCS